MKLRHEWDPKFCGSATSGIALLRVVDLGALEFVAVVDVDGFPGGEEVEGAQAFAVAVAGVLDAAEGQVNFCTNRRSVDVGDAGFEVADGREGAVKVLGVESAGEAVVDGVGDLNALLEGVELDERDDGAEDLFARDAHGGSDAAEDGWRVERALFVVAIGKRTATEELIRAFRQGDIDILIRCFD